MFAVSYADWVYAPSSRPFINAVGDLVNKIKEVFNSTKVLSVESVYEKIENSNDLKLIISMNKVLYDDINIIYTKLIFICDNTKSKLIKR